MGTTVPLQIKLITQLLMVSTRNTSRSNANPLRMQDPPGDADSRPSGTLEAMQANTSEVEAFRLTNQRQIGELEQLTRQMQHPREARQTQEGHNIPSREGQHNLDIPRGAENEAKSSRARGHGPQLAPEEKGNRATLGGRVGNEELHHPQQGAREQSWEQRFKSLQLGHSARSPAAHFDEFVYSAQVTLPEESDQLRLHRHSATAPGAQQLTLTSSSTLHRSRYLRSQISSGYIATRPQRSEPSNSL